MFCSVYVHETQQQVRIFFEGVNPFELDAGIWRLMETPSTPTDAPRPVDQLWIITWYTCPPRISSYAPFTFTKKVTRRRRAAPVRAQRGTQPRPPKAPCEATAVITAWARTSPHLQRCDRGVDGPGEGDDGPPAAGEGGHVACAPAAGRVSDLSTEAQAPARQSPRARDGFRTFAATLALNVFLQQLLHSTTFLPF
jgi:hypothetical protein